MIIDSHDIFNLLGKVTPKRFFNGIKVVYSYWYSRITRKPSHMGKPVSIAIEPTTSCNLRCPECPSGLRNFTRPTGMLTEGMFTKVMDELSSTLMYLTFYFQGEPYLNPRFLDLVKIAHDRKIYTTTSTNAHYLGNDNARKTVESGLDRLIISIDGIDQETYESYRVGGRLDKVIEGTKNILKWKKKLNLATPKVVFQFLVVKPNENQIEEVQQLGKALGVDKVALKTAQIYDYEDGSPLIPDNDKYSRYQKAKNGKYSIKNKLLDHCWKMWHSCVITWDGKVVSCCFDKDASHTFGELHQLSFAEIWNGERYHEFRKMLMKGRDTIDICSNCSEGSAVWA